MGERATVIETTLDELRVLRGEWSALCDRSACTPFQRPEWLLAWCATFPPYEPWLLAVRAHGRLVGLAPLFVWGTKRRVVSFVGAGVSDHLDAIAERGREREVGARIFEHLDRHHPRWDACELDALRADGILGAAALPPQWTEAHEPAVPSPRVPLGRGAAWDAAIPARRRARFARDRLRLEGAGASFTCTRGEGWRDALSDLFRLHAARWRSRGEPGVLGADVMARFHADVAGGFAARGSLRIYRLALGGACIAALYGFVEKEVLACYLHGLDPSSAKWSPGVVLLGMILEDAAREGLEVADLLRGAEPYKYDWGAVDVLAQRRCLAHGARGLASPGDSAPLRLRPLPDRDRGLHVLEETARASRGGEDPADSRP
jgi:CelD/BcsL family acetyltransferase involved in cellulose biosynthesis